MEREKYLSITRMLGAVGVFGFLFQLIILWFNRPADMTMLYAGLAAALALMAISVATNFDWLVALLGGRSGRGGARSLAASLGVLAALVVVNAIGAASNANFDATSRKIFSLSYRTRALLGLASPDEDPNKKARLSGEGAEGAEKQPVPIVLKPGQKVTVTLFADASEAGSDAEKLLEQYRLLGSDRLDIRIFHTDEMDDEEDARQAARSEGFKLEDMIFQTPDGEKRKFLCILKLGTGPMAIRQALYKADFYEQQGMMPALAKFESEEKFIGEAAVTSAIYRLAKIAAGERYSVIFVSGHGERSAGDQSGKGLSKLAAEMGRMGFLVSEAPLTRVGEVLKGVSAVVLAGTTRDLDVGDGDALYSYVAGGGRVFFLVEPKETTGETARITDFLARFGIVALNDAIVLSKRQSPAVGNTMELDISVYNTTMPVTAALASMNLHSVFYGACHVRTRFAAGYGKGAEVKPVDNLILAPPGCWSEGDLSDIENASPDSANDTVSKGLLSLAACAAHLQEGSPRRRKAEGRLFVIGDADFASNAYLDRAAGNKELFLGVLNWLVGGRPMPGISPKALRDRIVADNLMGSYVFWYSSVMAPLFFLVLGGAVWWRRGS